MLLCLFISTLHAEEQVCLAALILCCIFSYQRMRICFSLQCFPVACLPKTRLLLRITRDFILFSPLELQQKGLSKIQNNCICGDLKIKEATIQNVVENVRFSILRRMLAWGMAHLQHEKS